MPDFTTSYKPPGVYVEEEITPLVSVVGNRPAVVGIVGPSVGYREHTEDVVLTGTAAVTLTKLGVNILEGFEVAAADGTVYPGSAYTLTAAGGADADIATTTDNTTTIARNGTTIPDGATVYLRYRYADENFHSPFRAQDYDDVKDAFGEPLNLATGEIISPLSMAAKVAFENGANEVVLVSTTGDADAATRSELQVALAKLNAVSDVSLVVSLPVAVTGTPSAIGDTVNVGTDLRTHVENAADDGNFRLGIIGWEKDVTVDPLVAAAAFDSQRVVFAWPNKLDYYNGFTNTTIEVAGYYLAAAYAGRFAAMPVQMPLTKKNIRGFAGIPASVLQDMTKAQMNTWSEGGIAVTEISQLGTMQVRHGTTTDRSTVNTREASLVRARDTLVNLIQRTTENAGVIGTPIDETTPIRVKGIVQGALETAVLTDVIVSYQDLKARQRTSNPTVIEVKFQYIPAYPLNYIVIAFSINALTGESDIIDLTAAA